MVVDWCDYSVLIDNATQLTSILNSMEYEYYGPNGSGHLPITEDIQVMGEITISSEELTVPEECTSLDDCRLQVSFTDLFGAEGIVLSPDFFTLTLTICWTILYRSNGSFCNSYIFHQRFQLVWL